MKSFLLILLFAHSEIYAALPLEFTCGKIFTINDNPQKIVKDKKYLFFFLGFL